MIGRRFTALPLLLIHLGVCWPTPFDVGAILDDSGYVPHRNFGSAGYINYAFIRQVYRVGKNERRGGKLMLALTHCCVFALWTTAACAF